MNKQSYKTILRYVSGDKITELSQGSCYKCGKDLKQGNAYLKGALAKYSNKKEITFKWAEYCSDCYPSIKKAMGVTK